MASPLTSSNRVNIPAVCRICRPTTGQTAGTGVLVAPGVILTSRHAVGATQAEAASCTAIFFEGTKKRVAVVRLLPHKYFFTAVYPTYMDYCLVACEEEPLLNVTPVHVPLTQREWTAVCEGDVVLVVQHQMEYSEHKGDAGGELEECEEAEGGATLSDAVSTPLSAGDAAAESSSFAIRTFDEVLRCRDDLYYLKTNGLTRSAGCPVFNDLGDLIGLQSQRPGTDGEGMINRILSIVAIVRHMFAMKQLSILPQEYLARPAAFDDIWATWFTDKDMTQMYTMLGNFRGRATVREITRRLCEMTAKSARTFNSEDEACAVTIILTNLQLFPDDGELAELGLRALWNVSVGKNAVLERIAGGGGVQLAVTSMERFPQSEEIIQFGVVLLCNMADAGVDVFEHDQVAERLLVLLLAATHHFCEATVLQKFSLAMLTRLLRWQPSESGRPSSSSTFAVRMVEAGMLDHVGFLLSCFANGQVFLLERAVEFVAELVQDRRAVELSRRLGCSAAAAGGAVLTAPTDAQAKRRYPVTQLVDILISIMRANTGSDTIMASGNSALWGLGNAPEYRAAILLNPDSQEVLRLSVPSLVVSSK